ncbi:hypothetical protein VTI74DRAFT_10824 [Chaetomium olivicolor]
MQFGSAVGTACASFAITNIDDIFVLVTFFAEASTSQTLTPLKITLGQLLGFTVIVGISMIGFGASLVLPSEPIGFLGLLPILLGVWKAMELFFPDAEEEEAEKSRIPGMKSVLKVSMVTLMNGGDNIGTYVPLFSQAHGAEIAVYVVVFYILLGLWCLAAFLLMKQKHILAVCEKYARFVVPFLYIGLGIYIIVKSDCYQWSIERIDDAISAHSGQIIMAVTTTVLLLTCISAMLWLGMRRKKKAAAQPALNDEASDAGNASVAAETVAEVTTHGTNGVPVLHKPPFSLGKKGLVDGPQMEHQVPASEMGGRK